MHEKKYPLVTHLRDPRFLTLRSLQTALGRARSGKYLIEGVRHVARALEHGSAIESVFVVPSFLSNQFGQKLARRLRSAGVPGIQLDAGLYQQLTLANEPQGIGAVLKQRWTPLEGLKAGRDSLWLAMEAVDLPGNLGTILRTAEAAGVAGVFLLGEGCDATPDPWDPACVRASMGSLFSLRLVRATVREFAGWARREGVAMVGSAPGGLLDFKAFRCRWPAVLLIGSERAGLSPQLMEACDLVLRIPMAGRCDSINASVAAGVLLFEMAGQRNSV